MTSEQRVRWRMTLDELAYACGVNANTLEDWAQAGALGERWREKRDRGKWRHVTREAAQRAVICSRLLKAGVKLEQAASFSSRHAVGDYTDFYVNPTPRVSICISREDLP